MYTLNFSSFSGMTWRIANGEEKECRKAAATILKKRRNSGHFVRKLKSNIWECQEPENCFMIPDTAGKLSLSKQETVEDFEEEDFEEDC